MEMRTEASPAGRSTSKKTKGDCSGYTNIRNLMTEGRPRYSSSSSGAGMNCGPSCLPGVAGLRSHGRSGRSGRVEVEGWGPQEASGVSTVEVEGRESYEGSVRGGV